MDWKAEKAARKADRAARAHEAACDHCDKTVASTMKRGPPRGWLTDSSRQVQQVSGEGYSVLRAAWFCSAECFAAGPRPAAAR